MNAPVQDAPPVAPVVQHHVGLRLIAVFKFVKGILLLAAAVGLLRLVNTDISATIEHWVTMLRMDPDSKYLHWLLERIANIDPQDLKRVSAGSFFYSALLLTEGVGLWLERRWAEYLTIIATSSFIPVEIFELAKSLSVTRLVVLAVNAAIVWYLVATLRRDRQSRNHV